MGVGNHTQHCAMQHVQPAVLGGVVFTGIHAMQGVPLTPMLAATNVGFLYAYGVMVCPMEEISGRRSSLHNFLSGAILGYAGVAGGRVGIPFNLEVPMMMNRIPLPIGGAIVYGAIGWAFAAFQGKPM